MRLKVTPKYQVIADITEAEGKAISLVAHGANKRPFTVLKSDNNIQWGTYEKTELPPLTHNVVPTKISFSSQYTEQEALDYMARFEEGTFDIEKSPTGEITCKSKYRVNGTDTRDVSFHGVTYTLEKINVPDTIGTYEKENVEMKQEKKVSALANIKKEIVDALKEMPEQDLIEIIQEVLPEVPAEAETAVESQPEPEQTVVSECENKEIVPEEVKPEIEVLAESTEQVNAVEVTSTEKAPSNTETELVSVGALEKSIAELKASLDTQLQKHAELVETVTVLSAKLAEQTQNEPEAKEEIGSEGIVEVLEELQKSIDFLAQKVETLEYAPAISDVQKSQKTKEVQSAGKGFLAKFI